MTDCENNGHIWDGRVGKDFSCEKCGAPYAPRSVIDARLSQPAPASDKPEPRASDSALADELEAFSREWKKGPFQTAEIFVLVRPSGTFTLTTAMLDEAAQQCRKGQP